MPTTVVRRRNRWAFPTLVALLVAVPIAETWLLIQVGHAIGILPTILVLVVEALGGGWLMKREGSRAWTGLKAGLGSGRMPARELTDAALVLVGGILLLLPGFFTDLVGLVFLLPFTRPLARGIVGFFAAKQVGRVTDRITDERDLFMARQQGDGVVIPDPMAGRPEPASPDDPGSQDIRIIRA